jgi:prepilin-type N-terminal cleavage/methylation domain-containing protein
MSRVTFRKRAAFSLMELLAVVTILGIIAAIIVPRVTVSSDTAKQKVNSHNKATINAAVERWYIEKGSWPANNLSDIGADANYFPDGIPTNPTNGAAYTLNATTHRVN